MSGRVRDNILLSGKVLNGVFKREDTDVGDLFTFFNFL